jgi:hypothetical protein
VNETDINELRRACRAVAENTVWDTKPFDSSLITEHADRLLQLALRRAYHVEDDPRRLARCVHYLAQSMAIPPMWTRTDWFEGAIDALLILAHPINAIRGEALEFLNDLEKGIAEARS